MPAVRSVNEPSSGMQATGEKRRLRPFAAMAGDRDDRATVPAGGSRRSVLRCLLDPDHGIESGAAAAMSLAQMLEKQTVQPSLALGRLNGYRELTGTEPHNMGRSARATAQAVD